MTKFLLTTKQISNLLGVHPLTVERWVRNSLLPRPRKFGRENRYDLARCLRACRKHHLSIDPNAFLILEQS